MPDEQTTPEVAEEENPHKEVFEESPELKELHSELEESQKAVEEETEEAPAEDETAPNEQQEEETEEAVGEDKEKYSKRVTKRINEQTKKQRDAERRADVAEAKLAQYESAPPPAVPEQPAEQIPPDKTIAELDAEIAVIKTQRKQARRDFDDDLMDELDDKIDALKDKKLEAKFNKPEIDHSAEASKAAHEQSLKVASEDFASKNVYFKQFVKDDDGNKKPNPNYEHAKSCRVVEIGNELNKTHQGTAHEYFAEIERMVAVEFPEQHTTPKYPGVASVNPNSQVKQTEAASLDEVQKAVAHAAHPELSKRDAEKAYAKIVHQQQRSA